MKTNYLIFLFILLSLLLSAQQQSDIFTGRWYVPNVKLADRILHFNRELNDSMYLEMNFQNSGAVEISENIIPHYYKYAKDEVKDIISLSSNLNYKWDLNSADSLFTLKCKKWNREYHILDYSKNHFTLKMIENKVHKQGGTYYFISDVDVKQISQLDTLALTSDFSKGSLTRIKLKETNQFTMFYNVERDTLKKRMDDGTYVEQIIENSDQLHGIWQSNDLTQFVSLKFNEATTNNYKITERNELLYFIKE